MPDLKERSADIANNVYVACDDGSGWLILEARSVESARAEIESEWPGYYSPGVVDISLGVASAPASEECDEVDPEEVDYLEDVRLEIPHPEPRCVHPEGHRWSSPHSLLGGCKTNPGVWGGDNGGVYIKEVCARCGAYRMTETNAGTGSGVPGDTYTEISYSDPDELSLEHIGDRG